jgi:hypothetical protein
MNGMGMLQSDLHCSSTSGRLRSGGGARWWPARCVQRRQGWLAGVEPSAHIGGPFSTRSSPTRSMEDGIPTEVLVVVGDVGRRLATRRQTQGTSGKSWGSLWCTYGFGSSSGGGGGVSSSLATSRVRLGCDKTAWWWRSLVGRGKEMARVDKGHL